jgi:hypothetical protein
MLTVVTQGSHYYAGARFPATGMAIGFGYPHRSVPDARFQVMPRSLMYNIIRVGDSLLLRVLVAFVSRTNKSKTEIAAPSVPGRAQRLALFGPPPFIEGEDAAAYDQIVARTFAALKPVDVIDEMFIADVVFLEWEVLRLRRLKWSLIRARGLKALEDFLGENFDYDLYSEDFADDLAEILQENLPEDQAEDAQTLARECAQSEADSVDKVKKLLAGIKLNMDQVQNYAKRRKAKELVQEYMRREPDAVNLVDELLTEAGKSMEAFMADALANRLDSTERIDRLISIAENRRNASLHEIERRHAVLGETLRRSVQEIEDGEFEVIETTPAQGKNVA